MKKEVNHAIRKRFNEVIYHVARYMEILVVGVEFVKMLCRHSAQTVVEVLMFATARQMVVEHLRTWETLIGVIAIGILFAIRKFLMTEVDDMVYHERNKRNEETQS